MRNHEVDVQRKDVRIFMDYINHIPIDFVLIDSGSDPVENFNHSSYAKVLEALEIPYFIINLPDHIKDHYSKALGEINYKLEELTSCYSGLKDKSTPEAQELKFLIDRYTKDIQETEKYLNFKYRPQAIIKKILSIVRNRGEEITFAHIGDQKTFPSIMKLLKDNDIKSNVLFVHKAPTTGLI
ncbi:MAG: hypothetical protein ACFE8A_10500 [Candidatus Hodarchaeota archaeon]